MTARQARRLQIALKSYYQAENHLRTHELTDVKVIEAAQAFESARQELKSAKAECES